MLQHNSSRNAPSAEVKHLKGILKGGSMNKPLEVAKGAGSQAKLPSITTNPVAAAVSIPQNAQKTVIVTSSVYREKSMSPISSSAASSSPSPPPLAPLIDVVGMQGSGNKFNTSNKPQCQSFPDTNSMKMVKASSNHQSS